MAQLLAFCDSCGSVFGSGIEAINSKNITIGGSLGSRCRCGSIARIMEGTFNITNETIQIINAAEWTKEKLNRYKILMQDIKVSRANERELLYRLEKEAPEFKPLWSKFKDIELSVKVDIILFFLGFIINYYLNKQEVPQVNIYNNITNITNVTNNYSADTTNANLKQQKQVKGDTCICKKPKAYKDCCGKVKRRRY